MTLTSAFVDHIVASSTMLPVVIDHGNVESDEQPTHSMNQTMPKESVKPVPRPESKVCSDDASSQAPAPGDQLPLLLCAVPNCQEPFRDPALGTGFHPVLFSCGCSVCGECARTVEVSRLDYCPVCHRHETGHVVNTSLGELAEELRQQEGANRQALICEDCVAYAHVPAVATCKGGRCHDRSLCGVDAAKHQGFGHAITSLTSSKAKFSGNVACPRHPLAILTRYCKTHDVPVCAECLDDPTPQGHPRATHNVIPLAEAKKSIRKRLVAGLKGCKAHIKRAYNHAQVHEQDIVTAKTDSSNHLRRCAAAVAAIRSELATKQRQVEHKSEEGLAAREKLLGMKVYASGVRGGQLEAAHKLGSRAAEVNEVTSMLEAAIYLERVCKEATTAEHIFGVREWKGADVRNWALNIVGVSAAVAHRVSLISPATLLTMQYADTFIERGFDEKSAKLLSAAVLDGRWAIIPEPVIDDADEHEDEPAISTPTATVTGGGGGDGGGSNGGAGGIPVTVEDVKKWNAEAIKHWALTVVGVPEVDANAVTKVPTRMLPKCDAGDFEDAYGVTPASAVKLTKAVADNRWGFHAV